MSKLKTNNSTYTGAFFILFAIWQVLAILIFNSGPYSTSFSDGLIYFFDVAGTLQLILTIISVRNLYKGKILNLYMMFFLFLYVFSYGQFLMWTFGAYYENQMTVSSHVRFIDKYTVLRIQSLSLALLAIFHWGVLIATTNYNQTIKRHHTNQLEMSWLKKLSVPILCISYSINIYYSITGFGAAAIYGYSALFEQSMPPLIKYTSYMFIPSLFLVLVTRNYRRNCYFFLTFLFATYALPLLITGDRGSWIYFIGPWLWIYIRFVNSGGTVNEKESKKRIVFASILVGVILFISATFVSVRGVGYAALMGQDEIFSTEDFYTPFVKPFFEMGQTARVLGILIQDNLDYHWRYGNTYIADILGMVYPTIKVAVGYPDIYVENWMSSEYLGMIDYGVGFSSFAEAYLNGGLAFSWFYILLFGLLIGKLIFIRDKDVWNHPLKMFIALSAMVMLGPSVRATLDMWLREFFWGCLFIILVAKILTLMQTVLRNQSQQTKLY